MGRDPREPVDAFEFPWSNFSSFFTSRKDVDRPFLVELDHNRRCRNEWTVGEWKERVHATAQWLESLGPRANQSVAALLGNSAHALAVAYACWVSGFCYVPLNPEDSAERQAFILRSADAKILIYTRDHRDRVSALPKVAGLLTTLPPEGMERACSGTPDPATARDVKAVRETHLGTPAVRVYTSGTTGEPKGVVLTAQNLLAHSDALALASQWPADTRIMTVLPVHHVNGLIISGLLPWYMGLSTVVCDRFRSKRFWGDAASEGATVCSMVPTLLEFLLAERRESPKTPVRQPIRELLCGAGPLATETALDFEDTFGIPIRHLYGLSETTAVSSLMPRLSESDRRRWHRDYGFPSVGCAIPHVRMAVVSDGGKLLEPGVRGELVVRGATVMDGYAGLAEATRQVLRGGWFHTGDEGFWEPGDADGTPFFFITGRIKELIIRGGVNISSFEVDEVLRSHPAVEYALVVPFESRYYGEELAAYVTANQPTSEADILAHCARRLDFARCPKVVIFGDEVPYTSTGKAKRLELKERLAPELARYRETQFRRPPPAET